MTTRLVHVAIDAVGPASLARFWAEALGSQVAVDKPDVVAVWPSGYSYPDPIALPLIFVAVAEPKAGKNRLHIDLVVDDLDEATAEVEKLGGRWLEPGKIRELEGFRWRCMADPEGNEFDIDVLPTDT
jgi:predicted enzyme related to lactoylglutathione lyase